MIATVVGKGRSSGGGAGRRVRGVFVDGGLKQGLPRDSGEGRHGERQRERERVRGGA